MNGRPLGIVNYPKENLIFLKDNWKDMTDSEMSKHLGMPLHTIKKWRNRNGLLRHNLKVTHPEVIAKILEHYANGVMLGRIAELIGCALSTVSKIITRHWFRMELNEDTKVIVMQSKV